MTQARQVAKALRQAEAENKDIRRPVALLRQMEQAGAAGQFQRALQLSKQAMKAIENAKPLPPTPELFRNPLVGMLMDLLQVEREDLLVAFSSLNETYETVKTSTLSGVADTLKRGINALGRLSARRSVVEKRIQQIRGGPISQEDRDKLEAQSRERLQKARSDLGGVLAQAQTMTPEEFETSREKLVDEIIALVFPQPADTGAQEPGSAAGTPEPGAPGTAAGAAARPGAPPKPVPPPPTIEQRVRRKLLEAASPYLQVKGDPARQTLAGQLEDLFRQTRELLATGDYEQAEVLADRGLALLGITQPKDLTGTPTGASTAGETPAP